MSQKHLNSSVERLLRIAQKLYGSPFHQQKFSLGRLPHRDASSTHQDRPSYNSLEIRRSRCIYR